MRTTGPLVGSAQAQQMKRPFGALTNPHSRETPPQANGVLSLRLRLRGGGGPGRVSSRSLRRAFCTSSKRTMAHVSNIIPTAKSRIPVTISRLEAAPSSLRAVSTSVTGAWNGRSPLLKVAAGSTRGLAIGQPLPYAPSRSARARSQKRGRPLPPRTRTQVRIRNRGSRGIGRPLSRRVGCAFVTCVRVEAHYAHGAIDDRPG